MTLLATFFLAFVTTITAIYAAGGGFFALGLWRIRPLRRRTEGEKPFLSVVVAARNESASVDACIRSLLAQDFPADRWEILFVDDRSDDDTRTRAEAYQSPHLRVLSLADVPDRAVTGKQHALDYGIRRTRGDIIASTDADCVVPPTWLSALAEQFMPDTGVVVGFSMLDRPGDGERAFIKVQSLELLGLFSAFAGSLGWKVATACTGNNIAYRREVFEALGGFVKMGITVGEDNRFLQWVDLNTSWKIHPTFSPDVTVWTYPMPTFRAFLRQRLRWASNSLENRFSTIWFMVIAYGVNLLLPVALALGAAGLVPLGWALGVAGLRYLPEACLLWRGTRLFGRRDLLKYALLLAPFHSLYVLIVGIAGLSGRVVWKNRVYQSRQEAGKQGRSPDST